MKPSITNWGRHIAIAAVAVSTAAASVYESNYDPAYVKYVSVYTIIDNGEWGVTTFSCEHYLHYGQTLVIEDVPPCRHQVTGYLWIPVQSWYVSGLSLTTASGWEFSPNLQSGTLNYYYNFGSETVTLRARDAAGSIATSGIEWHVTDLHTDVVTHDWVSLASLTVGNLVSGRSLLVKARRTGGSSIFETVLKFAEGTVGYGAGGNPNKIRTDNSPPYAQERVSSCSLGCLRNVLSIKGKAVPTEDAIVQIMAQNGKPETDFLDPDKGMLPSEISAKYNLVLQQHSLTATRQINITKDQVIEKLNAGSVLVAAIRVDESLAQTLQIEKMANHVVVLRKLPNGKIEVFDPAVCVSKTEKQSIDKALDKVPFGSSPPQTSLIWEIAP